MLSRIRVLCLVAALCPAPVPAGPAEDLVAAALDGSATPGAAAGLRHADGTTQIAVGGLRVVSGAPVQIDDAWHIGSNTKAMTATLVARLAEAGLVSWDDTVGQVLGGLIGTIDPALAAADYGTLLSHRAGLTENLGLIDTLRLSGDLGSRDIRADRLDYAAAALSDGPAAEPGTFLYSNAGYVVAGAMIEATTGETWETLIARHVFAPLSMSGAGFGPPPADGPQGHKTRWLGGLRPVKGAAADNIPALGPAGTVHLPMADMLRFLAAHAEEAPGFLSPASWAHLHRPSPGQDYAMGWRVAPDGSLRHNGSNTLWFAAVGLVPGQGRAVAIFMNYADFDTQGPLVAALLNRALAPD